MPENAQGNQGLPYNHTSPWWAPPWLGRIFINLRSIMISTPAKFPGMAEQTRTTAWVRRDSGDLYGTKLFANWAGGLRQGVPVEGSVQYAPLTAGTDIGVPDPGSTMSRSGGRHPGIEQAPTGPQHLTPLIHPYTMLGDPHGTPGDTTYDAMHGDASTRAFKAREASASALTMQQGPNPDADCGIAGSFRIPRQFRQGLGHMAGTEQWGSPQHWDGGKMGDTLILQPPAIPATDGTNTRAIRGLLGSVRANDAAHVPAIYTPSSVG